MSAARRLCDVLQPLPRERENDPKLLLIINEASSLLEGGNVGFIAFNRVWSCLRQLPFWTFLLTTDSEIRRLVPPDDFRAAGNPENPRDVLASHRYKTKGDTVESRQRLERFNPLTHFELSIEDQRRIADPKLCYEECRMAIAEVSHPRHLAIFARPLWFAYTDVETLLAVAQTKLLGREHTYSSGNVNQVFAVCSNRLALDPVLQGAKSMPLAFEAVRNYMRIVKELHSDAGRIATIAVSEPILAVVAMDLLNATKDTWQQSIGSLTSELFQTSKIDQGRKGELFSRLLAVLAADSVRLDFEFRLPSPQRAAIPTFTVRQFLVSLYGTDHKDRISLIPAALLNSVMNFTHFVCAKYGLPADEIPRMCHDLLRRTAALQLADNQADIDLLIPIYTGDPHQPSDEAKCHWIGVQTKNQEAATTIINFLCEDIYDLKPVTAAPTAGSRKSARVGDEKCKRKF
jgi:hypothetical protein